MRPWIGVDLDGTLASYDDFKGAAVIGAPIELMVARVNAWLDNGWEVRIVTARVAPRDDGEDEVARKAIEEWCVEHIGEALPVTNAKDYGMVELWDDRVVQVIPNTGERADGKAEFMGKPIRTESETPR